MGSFSIWHWLVVLLVVVLIFGTKKLRGMGEDLGSAVKGFKEGMKTEDTPPVADKKLDVLTPPPSAGSSTPDQKPHV